MDEKIRYPHDSAYKMLFKHPEMVEGLLTGFVSEEFINRFDFSTLELCPGSYVTDDLRERHDDVVWRLRWQGKWCYVYILLEFQSTVDAWMGVRIANYTALLYQDLIKNKRVDDGRLPPVFPLVLYNGKKPWNAPRDVSQCIVSLSPILDTYQLRQKYFVVDIGRIPTKVLKNIRNAASSLVQLERGKTPEAIRIAIAELEKVMRVPEYTNLRRTFTVWLNRIILHKLQIKEPIPELSDLQEVNAMLAETVTQWTEQWKQEGLQAGLQAGLQKGLLRGRQEGMQEGMQEGLRLGEVRGEARGEAKGLCVAIIECLEEQFTVMPVPLVVKLRTIQDTEILRKLLVATLKVDSLEIFDAMVDRAMGMIHQ